MRTPAYTRAQTMWLLWLVVWPAVGIGVAGAVAAAGPDKVPWIIALPASIPMVAVLVFGRLRIQLDSHWLEWQFGYLGFPRWRLALADIVSVETIRTGWADGWGIHRGREGWIYNVSGFGAVRLRTRDGRSIRLGSDEPERLAAFIAVRLPRRA